MTLLIESWNSSDRAPAGAAVRIGLINNMPDGALGATETQFQRLLEGAAGTHLVRLRLSYLPEIVRSPAAQERLAASYWPLEALLEAGLDALIVTGAEPIAAILREERYWQRFTQVLDWAALHTHASVWSCLAAHAAVAHLDGIARRRLGKKCCGVFEHDVLVAHALMNGVATPIITPHSRWNDLPVEALRAAGYDILSTSPATGANLFARRVGQSLMLFAQGHPEYEAETLLKEYRRDVERYVRGQQPNYPTLPEGYLPPVATAILEACRERQVQFPYEAVAAHVHNTWQPSAIRIYANWLATIIAARQDTRRTASA
jgi:homoserine O-succinyltransferase